MGSRIVKRGDSWVQWDDEARAPSSDPMSKLAMECNLLLDHGFGQAEKIVESLRSPERIHDVAPHNRAGEDGEYLSVRQLRDRHFGPPGVFPEAPAEPGERTVVVLELIRTAEGHVTIGRYHQVTETGDSCTGRAAQWCPVHGECDCDYIGDTTERTLNDPGCPLHGPASNHAEILEV